jgi:hypothetical protein
MRRISKLFICLFLIAIFVSCNNSVAPEFNDRFAIYLLKEDTLLTKDVENLSISKLQLKSEPVLTYNDIILYDSENHKIYLNNNFSNYLGKDSTRVFSKIFGVPFVLVANGGRIYLGSFVTGISSWLPKTPKIVDYSVNNMEKSFIISGAPIYDESTFIDIRNDNRIFTALDGKLK